MVALRTRSLQGRSDALQALYDCQAAPTWGGLAVDKCAQDMMVYQEIITATRPDIIIECGSWTGGSSLFFAEICHLSGTGEVLSIDIQPPDFPSPLHPRLTLLKGHSGHPETIKRVGEWAKGRQGFVILDSDHTKDHVLAELEAYWPWVARGNYLIVEDTNVNGHPVLPDFGPGPWEAVQEWLPKHPGFRQDTDVEPYLTFAPGGYLKRIA